MHRISFVLLGLAVTVGLTGCVSTRGEAMWLDVCFVNPLPVMQRPAYRVWADTRHGRIVEAESLPTLVPVVVDGVCD
jgi:hypothetical protein